MWRIITMCPLYFPPRASWPQCTLGHMRREECAGLRETSCHYVTPFVRCLTGVVHEVPLTCESVHIGQTGRCLNDRLREHQLSVKSKTSPNLRLHCGACSEATHKPCLPLLAKTEVFRSRDRVARELAEECFITKTGCAGDPSIDRLPV